MHGLRDFLGAPLLLGDPRRFFIEVLIAASHEHGIVDDYELALAIDLVRAHPLMGGLGTATTNLVELANEALCTAGGIAGRAPAIANGLPSRAHRITAYALFEEVSWRTLSSSRYKELLRHALRISDSDVVAIENAVARGAMASYLVTRMSTLRTLIPSVSHALALRALGRQDVGDAARLAIRAFMLAIPELADVALVDESLEHSLRVVRTPGLSQFKNLQALAKAITEPDDRQWLLIYALAAELPPTLSAWQRLPFIGQVQAAFRKSDDDAALAAMDALAFSHTMPRPR